MTSGRIDDGGCRMTSGAMDDGDTGYNPAQRTQNMPDDIRRNGRRRYRIQSGGTDKVKLKREPDDSRLGCSVG